VDKYGNEKYGYTYTVCDPVSGKFISPDKVFVLPPPHRAKDKDGGA